MIEESRKPELLNRVAFVERLDCAISHCLQDNTYLSLMILDIDHFGYFTDKYGCQAGDDIIAGIGQLFKHSFPGDVITGHYGGDEFIAAVPQVKPEKVFDLGEMFFQDLEKQGVAIIVDGQEIQVHCTVSIGIATLPNDARDRDELIIKAKQALYKAKASGGRSIVIYEENDALTGLLNHFGIIKKLDQALVVAAREESSLSVISVDIDNLKEINDRFNRRAGDEIIKNFTALIKEKFQNGNYLGRYGGDQFVLLLTNTSADSAFIQSEQLRQLVEETRVRVVVDGIPQLLEYHISAGVASYPNDATERVDLMRKVVEALYRAKSTGRNRVCLPTSAQMVMKANYYTRTQLERLSTLAKAFDKSEAFLLREALDDLLLKYNEGQRYPKQNNGTE